MHYKEITTKGLVTIHYHTIDLLHSLRKGVERWIKWCLLMCTLIPMLELLIGSLSKVWWERAEEDDIVRQGHRISKWLIIFLPYPFPPTPPPFLREERQRGGNKCWERKNSSCCNHKNSFTFRVLYLSIYAGVQNTFFFLYGVMPRGESYLPSVTRAQNRGCSTLGLQLAPGQNLLSSVPSLNDWFFSLNMKDFSQIPQENSHLGLRWGREKAGPLLLRPQTLWASNVGYCWVAKLSRLTG